MCKDSILPSLRLQLVNLLEFLANAGVCVCAHIFQPLTSLLETHSSFLGSRLGDSFLVQFSGGSGFRSVALPPGLKETRVYGHQPLFFNLYSKINFMLIVYLFLECVAASPY